MIRVKTLTLYKKLYFFIKSLKSRKKNLALTAFYNVSREICWAIQKSSLHRPIKILHFLTPARIQNCLTYLMFNNKPPAS